MNQWVLWDKLDKLMLLVIIKSHLSIVEVNQRRKVNYMHLTNNQHRNQLVCYFLNKHKLNKHHKKAK